MVGTYFTLAQESPSPHAYPVDHALSERIYSTTCQRLTPYSIIKLNFFVIHLHSQFRKLREKNIMASLMERNLALAGFSLAALVTMMCPATTAQRPRPSCCFAANPALCCRRLLFDRCCNMEESCCDLGTVRELRMCCFQRPGDTCCGRGGRGCCNEDAAHVDACCDSQNQENGRHDDQCCPIVTPLGGPFSCIGGGNFTVPITNCCPGPPRG